MRLTIPTLIATTSVTALLMTPALAQDPVISGGENRPDVEPAFAEQTNAPEQITEAEIVQNTVAEGLVHPWGITVLPGDAGYLVTERPGSLRHISVDGEVSDPIAGVPEVHAVEQGGLLDIALAPDFEDSRVIYLTYAKPMDGDGMSATAAARAVLSEDMMSLTEVSDIFVQTPASPNPMHYGSRVVPASDGTVFITTGEHFTEEARQNAQDPTNSFGVIVRVTADGEPVEGNPFVDSEEGLDVVYSFGHRNVQSAALDADGQLWAIEHGPAGGDELNLIQSGGNYGWPIASYGVNYDGSEVTEGRSAHLPEFVEPRYYWDPVIAPGGMEFYDGEMFVDWQGDVLVGGLVAASVVRLDLEGDTVMGEEYLADGVGRVRDVAVDHDGSILFITDFEDGALIRLSLAE